MLYKALIIITLLFAGSAFAVVHSERGNYHNPNWGFSVRLSPTQKYEIDAPPHPNHGFRIQVSTDSLVWVNAESSDNQSLSDAADTQEGLWLRQGCATTHRSETSLGGKPARKISMICRVGINRTIEKTVSLVVALESPKDMNNTTYTVGVSYFNTGKKPSVALEIFSIVRRGFRFDPIN